MLSRLRIRATAAGHPETWTAPATNFGEPLLWLAQGECLRRVAEALSGLLLDSLVFKHLKQVLPTQRNIIKPLRNLVLNRFHVLKRRCIG